MDLTRLKHYLVINGVRNEIDEPIGFDGLKTTIKRSDYHGISAEVSVGTLEFYNTPLLKAADIVHDAYENDINTEIGYYVTDKDGVEVYSGVVDLSTYSEITGQSRKISCKVGEVGTKTTFNNRTETEVNLNQSTTMNGDDLAHDPEWKEITIPAKSIKYKNIMEQPETVLYDKNVADEALVLPDDEQPRMFVALSLANKKLNEFGSFNPQIYIAALAGTIFDGYVEPLFDKGEGFGDKFGETSTYNLDVDITIRMKFNGNIVTPRTKTPYFRVTFGIWEANMYNGSVLKGTQRYISNDGKDYNAGSGSYNDISTEDCHNELVYRLSGSVPNCDIERMYLGLWMYNSNDGWNDPTPFSIEIEKGSYVRMTLNSKQQTTVSAPMMMIHEAFNKVVEIISDNKLQVKSDWYGRFDSVVYPKSAKKYSEDSKAFMGCVGGGALKAITNGYKIRNIFTQGNARNMPMSFKDLFEAMEAQDCIGWGFVEEEGKLVVRVERWHWFYRSDIVLSINNPNKKTRKIDNDLVITSLNIGYKKYTTSKDINSNDNFHSERTYTSNTTAVSQDKSKLCKFIADNYAIEETRRAKDSIDESEEFKYDENVFVFALCGKRQASASVMNYLIPHDIRNADTSINSPEEVYNGVLSPARCALRWIERIFCVNGLKPLLFTSGKVNYMAKFDVQQTVFQGGIGWFYLEDSMNGIPKCGYEYTDPDWGSDSWVEEQTSEYMPLKQRYCTKNVQGVDIETSGDKIFQRVIRAETLDIEYPITIPQYQAIKRNPYGIIEVDGKKYWLKEMKFSFKNGLAEFTLIPKIE